MVEKVVVIGTGYGYYDFLGPALIDMDEVEIIGTVDLIDKDSNKDPAPEVQHFLRQENQQLSEVLESLKDQDPVVFLEHDVNYHTPDAEDLVEAGFRVIIEKPYAISLEQQETLERLVEGNPTKVALMEYYVSMKTAPARLGMGHIKQDSFYFTIPDSLLVEDSERNLESFACTLPEMVGDVENIEVVVLEGEGNTGKVHHRGAHVTDYRRGGGMINDLGLHVFGPLLGFRELIGDVDHSLEDAQIKVARCNEYMEMAMEVFGLSGHEERFIGDSYAEVDFETARDIPVHIKLGKYTPYEDNIRFVKLEGTKGTVVADMNECFVEFEDGSKVRAPKTEKKYLTVVRSALSELSGNPAYTRDTVTEVSLQGQRMVLSILDRAEEHMLEEDVRYDYGSTEIFD